MTSNKARGSKANHVPDNISRSSSMTVVSPVVRDGMEEIVNKLTEIVIKDLPGVQHSPETARTPDIMMGELLQDISELEGEVNSIKLAQDAEIREIQDAATNNVKKEIVEMLQGEISAIIMKSVAAQVEEEMIEWGKKPGVPKLVNGLKDMVNTNNALLDSGNIQLRNSRSRHANSTIDVHDDFTAPLRQIKRHDGHVSTLFPVSLRELFSYDGAHLTRLLEEYDLRPLEKHSENLNRFLIFIGVNVSVPDQLVDFIVDEQLPAYPLGGTTRLMDEGNQKANRRRSSASEKSAGGPWFNIFSGSS